MLGLLTRVGTSPSGASLSLQTIQSDLSFNLDTWDLGVCAEHRMGDGFRARLRVGVRGLRGLRVGQEGIDQPDLSADSSAFLRRRDDRPHGCVFA